MATAPDDWQDNPVFGGRGLTPPSTYIVPLSQPRERPVHPATGKIIAELGLRYRPSLHADLEAYAHTLRLLTQDVADVDPGALGWACREWVRTKPFLPKANELIALAHEFTTSATQGTDTGLAQLQDHCDRLNALNGGRDGWHVVGQRGSRTIAKRNERRSDAA